MRRPQSNDYLRHPSLRVAGGCLLAFGVLGLVIAILIKYTIDEIHRPPRMAPPHQIASVTSPDGRYCCVVIANELEEDEIGSGNWYELVILDAVTQKPLPGRTYKQSTDSARSSQWDIEWKEDSFYVWTSYITSSKLRGTIDETGQHWTVIITTRQGHPAQSPT